VTNQSFIQSVGATYEEPTLSEFMVNGKIELNEKTRKEDIQQEMTMKEVFREEQSIDIAEGWKVVKKKINRRKVLQNVIKTTESDNVFKVFIPQNTKEESITTEEEEDEDTQLDKDD